MTGIRPTEYAPRNPLNNVVVKELGDFRRQLFQHIVRHKRHVIEPLSGRHMERVGDRRKMN